MFRGRYEHSLDEKGRLSIPAKFRDLLLSKYEQADLIICHSDICLSAFPLKEWEIIEEKILKLPQFNPKVMEFLRFFVSSASECSVDKLGRILLPQALRDFAKIDKECIICGQLSKFELWSKHSWQEKFSSWTENYPALMQTLAEHGINI